MNNLIMIRNNKQAGNDSNGTKYMKCWWFDSKVIWKAILVLQKCGNWNWIQAKTLELLIQLEVKNNGIIKELIFGQYVFMKERIPNCWKNTEATYKGVTGGFPNLNDIDVQSSKKFLSNFLLPGGIENKRAIGDYWFLSWKKKR